MIMQDNLYFAVKMIQVAEVAPSEFKNPRLAERAAFPDRSFKDETRSICVNIPT